MPRFARIVVATLSAVFALACSAALAQTPPTLLTPSDEDAVIRNNLCLGDLCPSDPTTNFVDGVASSLLIMDTRTRIDTIDTSDDENFPGDDWSLLFNDPEQRSDGGIDRFSIQNRTEGTTPFQIEGDAPSNAIFVEDSGEIGLGTTIPLTNIHIVDSANPGIRIESTSGQTADWLMNVGNDGLALVDMDAGPRVPVLIANGAPNDALRVAANGDIGMGLDGPEGKLHTIGLGTQKVYFESADGGAVQVRFRTDSENRRFLAVDNGDNVKSQIIFKDNEIQFTGQTDSGANLWLAIGPSGIVSQGPTCNPGPCDATFDPDVFTVPPLKERTAYMWEHRHLWAVGPTKPGEPINLTQKTGAILHELEVAYIYIEQLHDRIQEMEARDTRQDVLNARLLARIEALERE